MTTYLQVWTLQRGVINPPEKLSDADQYLAERAAVQAGLERDPQLTQRQRWQEEITRATRFSISATSERRNEHEAAR